MVLEELFEIPEARKLTHSEKKGNLSAFIFVKIQEVFFTQSLATTGVEN